jgi:hypothetical protein
MERVSFSPMAREGVRKVRKGTFFSPLFTLFQREGGGHGGSWRVDVMKRLKREEV